MSLGIFLLLVILLCIIASTPILIPSERTWKDKKHGMKYTIEDNSIILAEWDFDNPVTILRLLNILIQSEPNSEQRAKYIIQYNKMKESLKKEGYDVSDFRSYETKGVQKGVQND